MSEFLDSVNVHGSGEFQGGDTPEPVEYLGQLTLEQSDQLQLFTDPALGEQE